MRPAFWGIAGRFVRLDGYDGDVVSFWISFCSFFLASRE